MYFNRRYYNYYLQVTNSFYLSIMFILFGIDEIKERQKAKAFVYFLGSAFILYVGVSSLLS
ncbi:hypothetical protein AT257_27225 [Bacillus cereus]|nr:hypothetical protein AT257_27225 [Bacillus cereus]